LQSNCETTKNPGPQQPPHFFWLSGSGIRASA